MTMNSCSYSSQIRLICGVLLRTLPFPHHPILSSCHRRHIVAPPPHILRSLPHGWSITHSLPECHLRSDPPDSCNSAPRRPHVHLCSVSCHLSSVLSPVDLLPEPSVPPLLPFLAPTRTPKPFDCRRPTMAASTCSVSLTPALNVSSTLP
jgi:hypothetical protein